MIQGDTIQNVPRFRDYFTALRQATLSFALALSFALSLTAFASKRGELGKMAVLQRYQNV